MHQWVKQNAPTIVGWLFAGGMAVWAISAWLSEIEMGQKIIHKDVNGVVTGLEMTKSQVARNTGDIRSLKERQVDIVVNQEQVSENLTELDRLTVELRTIVKEIKR